MTKASSELIVCHDVVNFTDRQLAYMSFRQAGRSHDSITQLTIDTCNFEYRATRYMPGVKNLLQRGNEWTCDMMDNTGFMIEAAGKTWWQAVLRARALATIPSSTGMEFPAWVLLA